MYASDFIWHMEYGAQQGTLLLFKGGRGEKKVSK
jgi:hypothetical protein